MKLLRSTLQISTILKSSRRCHRYNTNVYAFSVTTQRASTRSLSCASVLSVTKARQSTKMAKRSEADVDISKHPSTKRAKQIDAELPYDELKERLEAQASDKDVTKVVHWFRSKDLRIQDNRALSDASAVAKEAGKPLIAVYLNCPAEFRWHGTSPARIDFIFETLKIVQKELKDLDIPLVFLEASDRDEIVPQVVKFVRDNDVSHVFANYEYEVDELRRDAKLLKEAGSKDHSFQVALRHDQTVMEPGTMTTGAGKPMKVFTPYHQAWLGEVKSDPSLLDTAAPPSKNPGGAQKELKSMFDSKVPSPPKEHLFEYDKERDAIRKMWPAGHDAGMKRMNDFIQNKIEDYAATRSNPAKDSSSRMSPYFAAGVVSMREALTAIKKANGGKTDFSQSGASPGIASWVREIVFRELYRQTTLTTPHTAMNLPQNLKFDFVQWEDDPEGYKRWEEGTLGVPFVDAGMRQIKAEAYMHNRLRMNVSSYLYCNLLIDYRRGERYFVNTLIDWDLSNVSYPGLDDAERFGRGR